MASLACTLNCTQGAPLLDCSFLTVHSMIITRLSYWHTGEVHNKSIRELVHCAVAMIPCQHVYSRMYFMISALTGVLQVTWIGQEPRINKRANESARRNTHQVHVLAQQTQRRNETGTTKQDRKQPSLKPYTKMACCCRSSASIPRAKPLGSAEVPLFQLESVQGVWRPAAAASILDTQQHCTTDSWRCTLAKQAAC
jgi:hypothetical protein